MLCESVVCPQSLGLGGGFIATIYIRATGEAITLNAREVAPIAARADMFANDTVVSGTRSIGVPGALAGYWALHQRHGRLPWARLFDAAIDLCQRGTTVSPYFSSVLDAHDQIIHESPTLSALFVDPKTQEVWKVGDRLRMPKLAETLQVLAVEGVDGLYRPTGTIYRRLQADLQVRGGITY